jgi:hypothetical protein
VQVLGDNYYTIKEKRGTKHYVYFPSGGVAMGSGSESRTSPD